MTVKEKAEEYGQMVAEGTGIIDFKHVSTNAYMDGYNEAMCFRDPKEELPLQTKLEMFYDFLYERGIAKQIGVGIDTIVKHFIDEKLSGNDR